jgi:hypothetical protein
VTSAYEDATGPVGETGGAVGTEGMERPDGTD